VYRQGMNPVAFDAIFSKQEGAKNQGLLQNRPGGRGRLS